MVLGVGPASVSEDRPALTVIEGQGRDDSHRHTAGVGWFRLERGATWVRPRHGTGYVHAVKSVAIYRNLPDLKRRQGVSHLHLTFECGGSGFDDRLMAVVVTNAESMERICWRCRNKVLSPR